jgi:hypothetical protein
VCPTVPQGVLSCASRCTVQHHTEHCHSCKNSATASMTSSTDGFPRCMRIPPAEITAYGIMYRSIFQAPWHYYIAVVMPWLGVSVTFYQLVCRRPGRPRRPWGQLLLQLEWLVHDSNNLHPQVVPGDHMVYLADPTSSAWSGCAIAAALVARHKYRRT